MLLPAKQSVADDDYEDTFEDQKEAYSDCEKGSVFRYWPRSSKLDSNFFLADQPMPSFNRRGTSGKGATLVTKHNAALCGKRNVARVMNTFPPEFDTGNVLNEMQLSNRVYNQLKLHSYAEEKRMNRLHDKVEKATAVSCQQLGES